MRKLIAVAWQIQAQLLNFARDLAIMQHNGGQVLPQVLETWPQHSYADTLAALEKALLSACQDASPETRALARSMFGTFSGVWPKRLPALLGHLQPALQAKMRQAIAEHSSTGLYTSP